MKNKKNTELYSLELDEELHKLKKGGATMRDTKVIVSKAAVLARIKRKLKRDGEKLCKSRPGRSVYDLGDYYTVDLYSNFIVSRDIDPAEYAKELGVLNEYEQAEKFFD